MRSHVDVIRQRSALYGSSHLVHDGAAAEEECERELEEEEEEEEEVEREVPRVQARAEDDWHYPSAMRISDPAGLSAVTTVLGLKACIDLLHPSGVQSVDWSADINCTVIFAQTIARSQQSGSGLNEYMRPVNWILAYPNGKALLVSEREADAFLELGWASGSVTANLPSASGSSQASAPVLVNLCYAAAGFDADAQPRLALLVSHRAAAQAAESPQRLGSARRALNLGVHEIVSLQLLNGHASFGGQQFGRLCRMVGGRREAARELVSMRGKQSLFAHSNLELACD